MSGKNTGKTTPKKSHVMSIRFDEETYDKLKELAKERGVKKSRLLKDAFNRLMSLEDKQLILAPFNIGRSFMRAIFTMLTEDNLKDLALKVGERWLEFLKIRIIDNKMDKSLNSLLSVFKEGVGPSKANWFEKINFRELENGNVIVYGIHSLHENFSLFLKFFLSHLMKNQFNFELIEKPDNISRRTIELEFSQGI